MRNGRNNRTVDYIQNTYKMEGDPFTNASLDIVLGSDVQKSSTLQMIASMVVNLAIRLHPVIKHVHVCIESDGKLLYSAPKWRTELISEHISTILGESHSGVTSSVGSKVSGSPYSIVIGKTTLVKNNFLSVTSENWIASIANNKLLEVVESNNPVGAYTAACLAITEIWHKFIALNISHSETILKEDKLSFNTFTYSSDLTTNPELPKSIQLNNLSIIGVGAGGGATAFTLASLHNLHGEIFLMDKETVSETNPNRYIHALLSDVGEEKAELAHALFDHHNTFQAKYKTSSFQKLEESLTENLKYVCCMIDNAETKRLVNYSTPFLIWDGAAENGELRLGRHLMGSTECLACKYPEDLYDETDMLDQRSSKFGLTPSRINELSTKDQFNDEDISVVEQFTAEHLPGLQMPIPGESWSDFEGKNCGQIKFETQEREAFQMPIAPILVGILTTGEIIKEFYFTKNTLDSRHTLDVTKMNLSPYAGPRKTRPTENCPHCSDPDFIEEYEEKWSS